MNTMRPTVQQDEAFLVAGETAAGVSLLAPFALLYCSGYLVRPTFAAPVLSRKIAW